MSLSKDTASILVVDDDIELTEMLTAYFQAQGYLAVSVNSGAEAIEACESACPDMVILDINMPDIDGFKDQGSADYLSNW